MKTILFLIMIVPILLVGQTTDNDSIRGDNIADRFNCSSIATSQLKVDAKIKPGIKATLVFIENDTLYIYFEWEEVNTKPFICDVVGCLVYHNIPIEKQGLFCVCW